MGTYIDKNSKGSFFVGPEAEYTSANGKKTLFVVGSQKTETIEELTKSHKISHVYFGTSGSFSLNGNNWEKQLVYFLDRGYTVSLEYPANLHGDILNLLSPGIWQSRLFVPVMTVKIPRLEDSNPNLTLKIEDLGFQYSNPGVWCLNCHELTDNNRLTGWHEYSLEELAVNEKKETPKPAPVTKKAPEVVKKATPQLKTKPVIELKEADQPVEKEIKNNTELGLDLDMPKEQVIEEKVVEIKESKSVVDEEIPSMSLADFVNKEVKNKKAKQE